MIRVYIASLLLGSLALAGILTQFFSPAATTPGQGPMITWNAETAKVVLGEGRFSDGKLQLTLSPRGLAGARLLHEPMAARENAYLHLEIEGASKDLSVVIYWKSSEDGNQAHTYRLQRKSWSSLWLSTSELAGWSGSVSSLQLMLIDKPGEVIQIKDFATYAASPTHQLRAIYSDLTAYAPWARATMNSYTGVDKVSSFYPAPLALGLLILSLLGYGFILLVFRASLSFRWSIVGLIFLACWISLDLLWQKRLLHQVVDTADTFSGKDTSGKLAVGPDAKLYEFVSAIVPHVDSTESRIFISTTDIYIGMRAAYYLYPLNVFWSLQRPDIPPPQYLREGDYIVLLKPSVTRLAPSKNRLLSPESNFLKVEEILTTPSGSLVRLL